MEVHDEKARDLLVRAGARADGVRVRLPEFMVERGLRSTPKRLTLYNRRGEVAIRAWGHQTYYGGGSDCLNILDHRTASAGAPWPRMWWMLPRFRMPCRS